MNLDTKRSLVTALILTVLEVIVATVGVGGFGLLAMFLPLAGLGCIVFAAWTDLVIRLRPKWVPRAVRRVSFYSFIAGIATLVFAVSLFILCFSIYIVAIVISILLQIIGWILNIEISLSLMMFVVMLGTTLILAYGVKEILNPLVRIIAIRMHPDRSGDAWTWKVLEALLARVDFRHLAYCLAIIALIGSSLNKYAIPSAATAIMASEVSLAILESLVIFMAIDTYVQSMRPGEAFARMRLTMITVIKRVASGLPGLADEFDEEFRSERLKTQAPSADPEQTDES